MKNALLMTTALTFLLGDTVWAANDTIRSISVSGTVQTKIAPDQIVWRISLTDTDKNLHAAKTANDEHVKAVLALRDELAIADDDLETGQIRIQREYERGEHGQRGAFKHFSIYRSVTIRQRELNRFDEYLERLVASADMEVDFSFESSEFHEARAETRLKALSIARDKAKAMAEVVGARLGRVLTINEHSESPGFANGISNSLSVMSTPDADSASDTFIPGAISVSVTVYAVFELD